MHPVSWPGCCSFAPAGLVLRLATPCRHQHRLLAFGCFVSDGRDTCERDRERGAGCKRDGEGAFFCELSRAHHAAPDPATCWAAQETNLHNHVAGRVLLGIPWALSPARGGQIDRVSQQLEIVVYQSRAPKTKQPLLLSKISILAYRCCTFLI